MHEGEYGNTRGLWVSEVIPCSGIRIRGSMVVAVTFGCIHLVILFSFFWPFLLCCMRWGPLIGRVSHVSEILDPPSPPGPRVAATSPDFSIDATRISRGKILPICVLISQSRHVETGLNSVVISMSDDRLVLSLPGALLFQKAGSHVRSEG